MPTDPEPPSGSPASLPLDRALLEGLFGSDKDTIELMIGLFVDSLEPWRERLHTESAVPVLRALAHEIKGAASTVGAQPLAQSAAELEMQLVGWMKEGAAVQLEALPDAQLPQLQAYRRTLLRQIDELLSWAAERS